MKAKKRGASLEGNVSAGGFPALRKFLTAYFHEDWCVEHESPAGAARQFVEDADSAEREEVAREWQKFRKLTREWSLADINKVLYEDLGANWHLTDAADLDAISEVLRA